MTGPLKRAMIEAPATEAMTPRTLARPDILFKCTLSNLHFTIHIYDRTNMFVSVTDAVSFQLKSLKY